MLILPHFNVFISYTVSHIQQKPFVFLTNLYIYNLTKACLALAQPR